nr:MAG TPA: hypothetical protein [Caudoviricetes sp.]
MQTVPLMELGYRPYACKQTGIHSSAACPSSRV